MIKPQIIKTITLIFTLILIIANFAYADNALQTNDNFGPVGTLHIYKNSTQTKQIVLFITGDGGWNLGVIDMAKPLVELDSMVVGVGITHYIKQLNASSDQCTC